MSMQTLQGLGWQWRQNGVVLCLQIDGKKQCVFVPLNRVWHEFHTELAKAGVHLPATVGAEISVGGLFSSIAHAVKGVTHAVTHNAITNAAAKVANTAASYAEHAVGKIPVVGPLANTVAHLASIPAGVAEQLAAGGRIDRVAMNSLKSALKDVKQVAPYATTVLSLVPGVGSGLSGAIGAGLALASGQNITAALEQGLRNAMPGGALAAKAFDVASAAMQGKPIDQIALAALPITPAARQALADGINVAKDLAAGKHVTQAIVDAATHQLPPQIAKAVQIGAAIGHAKNLQSAVGAVSQAATLATNVQSGYAAQALLKQLPPGTPQPLDLMHAVKKAVEAQAVIAHAQQNAATHAPSANLIGALNLHNKVNPPNRTNLSRGGAKLVRPRYHTQPAATAPAATVGAPLHHLAHHALATRAAHHNHPVTHPVGARFEQFVNAHRRNSNGAFNPHRPSMLPPPAAATVPNRSFMAPRARIFAPMVQPHHRHHATR